MGLRFSGQVDETCFFVTTTFRDFRRFGDTEGVYSVLSKALAYSLHKYNAKLPAYIFMPSHLYLLLAIEGKHLSEFMRDFKKYTAQKGLKDILTVERPIWMPRFDRVAISSERVFRAKLEYIHNNPVKAGIVTNGENWTWSSAGVYSDGDGSQVPVWTDWHW